VSAAPVLTTRELGRATLARQGLLERVSLDPVAAIERFGPLQAQEPASPFIALWSRLAGFEAAHLREAIADRAIVKAVSLRGTLHLLSAADYLAIEGAIRPMLRAWRARDQYRDADVDDIDAVEEAALDFADRPRTNREMAEFLGALDGVGGRTGEDVWWRVRRHAPFVIAPTDGEPWSFGRRVSVVAARSWLSGAAFADERTASEHLVRRYLGAFGPASLADMHAWSRIAIGRLRPVAERLDGVMRLPDEAGKELFDLAGAPRPDASVEAPPRLLPMWDSALLAHADRSRILPPDLRRSVIATNGDVMPTVTVDGRVAGLWWAEPLDATGQEPPTRIALERAGSAARTDERSLAAEAKALAGFVGPLEPAVYARFRTRAGRQPLPR
jgi:hypothetical protein